MKESPNTGNEPKNQKNDSTHSELVSSSTTESNLTEKQSGTTKQNSNEADSKHNPLGIALEWWKRKWKFVVIPEHANAIIAIFSALLFIATTLYTVFAGLQWIELRNSNAQQRQIALAAYGAPLMNLRPDWTGLLNLRPGKKMWVILQFQNNGARDAESISAAIDVQFSNVRPRTKLTEKNFKFTRPYVLRPLEKMIKGQEVFAFLDNKDAAEPLSPEQYAAYKSGNVNLYIWIGISYVEFPGEARKKYRYFCRYVSVADVPESDEATGYVGPYHICDEDHPQ